MKTIKVTATPFETKWAVECSVCDFMALVSSAAVDTTCTLHAHLHTKDN